MPTEKEPPKVTGLKGDGSPNLLGDMMSKKMQQKQQKEFEQKTAKKTIHDVKHQFGPGFDSLSTSQGTPSGLKPDGKPDTFSQLTMSKKTLQEQQARHSLRQAKQTIAKK